MRTRIVLVALAALAAAPALSARAGGAPPVGLAPNAPLNMVVKEDGANSFITVNSAPAPAIGPGPDGVMMYSTGGVFVFSGDIYYLNADTTISDMIRIYGATGLGSPGDTFSVFSFDALEHEAPDSPFDAPALPAGVPSPSSVTTPENSTYNIGPSSYQFLSDLDTPEPASVALVGLGAASLFARRRRA